MKLSTKPSPSESVPPASNISAIPSLSLSKSNLSSIPSPSVSSTPSTISGIPSLSSSSSK